MSAPWSGPARACNLPDPTPQTAPETAAVFEAVAASRGWVSNLLTSLGHAPEALSRFSAVGHYGRYGTELNERQRELVICIVGRNIPYAWAHHSPLALDAGVTEAELATIKAGCTPEGMNAADAALCDFTFAITGFGGTPEATWQAVQRSFTPRQTTDIAVLAAYYIAAGALIMGLGVKVEPPEVLAIEREWQKKPRLGDRVIV
ncbi:MAG TPA: carboxymuconolactone decarboxylase family protein [Falsiroseomonas sp.]|jgi:alkylhydroperoxidase family enzyme|nr:carboxymuconolactone decarboxylase family protein [Falsiroseomonas sp.]